MNDKQILPITISEEVLPYEIFVVDMFTPDIAAHDAYEFIMVLDGEIHVKTETYDRLLTTYELVFINSQTIHKIKPINKHAKLLVCQFRRNEMIKHYDTNKILFFNNELEKNRYTRFLKENLIRLYLETERQEYSSAKKRFDQIIDIMNQHFVNNNKNMIDSYLDGVDEIVQNMILDISIGDIGSHSLTLADYAEKHNINYYYLSKLFKETTGITFSNFIRNHRMYKSTWLLIKTNKTITEVAYQSGYTDIKAMGKDFLKVFEMSPSKFRKQHHKIKHKDSFTIPRLENFLTELSHKEDNTSSRQNKFYQIDSNAEVLKTRNYGFNTVLDLSQIDHNSLSFREFEQFMEKINLTHLRLHLKVINGRYQLVEHKNSEKIYSDFQIERFMEYAKDLNLDFVLVFHQMIGNTQIDYSAAIEEVITKSTEFFGCRQIKSWRYEFYFDDIDQYSYKEIETYFYRVNENITKAVGCFNLSIGLYAGIITEDPTTFDLLDKLLKLEPISFLSFNYQEYILAGTMPTRAKFQKVLERIHRRNKKEKVILVDIDFFLEERVNAMTLLNEALFCLFNLETFLQSNQEYFLVNWMITDAMGSYPSRYISDYGIETINYYFNTYARKLFHDVIFEEKGISVMRSKKSDDYSLLLYSDYTNKYLDMSESEFHSDKADRIHISLQNLTGIYKVTEYHLDFETYFYYYQWLMQLGSYSISKEERQMIQSKMVPNMKIHYMESKLEQNIAVKLAPLDVVLITLVKISK